MLFYFIHISYKLVQLLETMMKNCGEYVQFEVAEQHVLQEMVKIIQKKVYNLIFSFLYFYISYYPIFFS
jgi:hypothetical protein